jgi:SAM-dependent methyltransferase
MATLGRSIRLFGAFRQEQSNPRAFYGMLADDSVAQVGAFVDLRDKVVLDVGGGPGYFADAFRDGGSEYVAIDADVGELSAHSVPGPGSVLGSGMALPIASASVDICYSSNVLEHVSDPQLMAAEMLRVTRPGGTLFLSYTTWLSPWGGHETAPWHYLGGARAAARYTRRNGRPPKNEYGRSLFPLSARVMLDWATRVARSGEAEIIDAFPRYHPRWAHWIARVPAVREVAVWNLVIVLRRR